MNSKRVRDSLHFYTYQEHSLSLKLAADDMLENINKVINIPEETDNDRIKSLGLIRGCMLLYAVSIELMLKAKGLYEERNNILNGSISSFKDFIKKWNPKRSDGHGYFDIISYYKIDITEEEKRLLDNFQSYTSWAGRFPYPKKDDEVKIFERDGRSSGSIGLRHKTEVQQFLNKLMNQMKT